MIVATLVELSYLTRIVTHRPRDRSFIRIVRVDTPTTGTEKVSRGWMDRTTERAPLRGDDAVTAGTISSGFGTGPITGSDVGVGVGAGLALGSAVGVGDGLGDGVGVADGVGDMVPGGVTPAATSRAAPTWRRPNPESGLRPPSTNGLALWVRLARTWSGVSVGFKDRSRATAPVTCGVAMDVPVP